MWENLIIQCEKLRSPSIVKEAYLVKHGRYRYKILVILSESSVSGPMKDKYNRGEEVSSSI